MTEELIHDVSPYIDDMEVIATNAIDCIHDCIDIVRNENGWLSDVGYTYINLTEFLGLEKGWNHEEIKKVCQRYACDYNETNTEIVSKHGSILGFIQCLTAVEAHVLAMYEVRKDDAN